MRGYGPQILGIFARLHPSEHFKLMRLHDKEGALRRLLADARAAEADAGRVPATSQLALASPDGRARKLGLLSLAGELFGGDASVRNGVVEAQFRMLTPEELVEHSRSASDTSDEGLDIDKADFTGWRCIHCGNAGPRWTVVHCPRCRAIVCGGRCELLGPTVWFRCSDACGNQGATRQGIGVVAADRFDVSARVGERAALMSDGDRAAIGTVDGHRLPPSSGGPRQLGKS